MKTVLIFLILTLPTFLSFGENVLHMAESKSITKAEVESLPIAMHGYDVLSYHVASGAIVGSSTYQAVYNGQRYLFASKENQERFSKNPEKFLPEFNGYCAQSLVEDKLVEADPKLFLIDEGKLYFFSKPQALAKWQLEKESNYTRANKRWKYEAVKLAEQKEARKKWMNEGKVQLFTF